TNDIPVARADVATTDLLTPITIAVLGNDTDVDGDPLTVTDAIVDPSQGTVVINADGTLTFTPAGGVPGSATISYTISDDNGGTATSTVDVTVTAVNRVPVAVDDQAASPYSVNLGMGAVGSWSATDSKSAAVTVTAFNGDGVAASRYINVASHQIGVNGS